MALMSFKKQSIPSCIFFSPEGPQVTRYQLLVYPKQALTWGASFCIFSLGNTCSPITTPFGQFSFLEATPSNLS